MSFWVQAAAARHPGRVAIEACERSLTYAELSAVAIDGARALQALDVGEGDRVALEIDDRLELALALHACLVASAPAVPIDPRLSAGEREVRASGAMVRLQGRLWGQPGGPLAGLGDRQPRAETDRMVATVMHTSGTTAAPKPVGLTYGNWLWNALGSAVALGLDPDERWLCALPLAHVGGLSILIRSTIYATTVVLHERFQTEPVLDALMDPGRRITLVSLVPTMLARLLDAGLREPPTLRWALLGGGPLPAPLLSRAAAARVPVAPTYGMTEACSQIATFGCPLPGVEVEIAADGEVIVRGPVVAPGSLGGDGWLHTGDLGRFERGRLVIAGRKSETIITGGENVSPAEVEAALLDHPAVADAGVFARPDAEWGEAVVAAVVLRDGATAEPAELRAHCAGRLATFQVPKQFEFVPALPRTQSGKLRRRELR